jgi:hypothetical protein
MPCSLVPRPGQRPDLGQDIKSIPGDPKWALAPAEMAWQGKSLGAICAQIKDPARNGGKSLAELHHHMAEDHLVGWAWNPGDGPRPRAGHAGPVRRAGEGLDRHGREVPEGLRRPR